MPGFPGLGLPRVRRSRLEDVGSRSVGSENGGAVDDGLPGGDPDDRGASTEHGDEENDRGERGPPNSGPLAP